jgi:HEXXH motif-containing protein
VTAGPTVAIEPLGAQSGAEISRALAARRLARAGDVLAHALRGEGERDGPLEAWAGGIAALLRDDQDRGRALLEHWSVEFLLARAASGTSRAHGDLACGLLGVALRDGAPALRATVAVRVDRDGAVPCHPAGARVVVAPGAPAGPFELDAGRANGARLPFARPRGWNVPVVPDDPAASLVAEAFGSAPPADRDAVPALADELDAAAEILAMLWPDTIAWLELLVPAFIEVAPVARGQTLSGSFGPGRPVYLSASGDPFALAENLVHELQHLRLGLHAMEAYATRWNDEGAAFASPYRPDPRPLRGLHLGLHAFLAVNELRLRAAARGTDAPRRLRDAARSHDLNLDAHRTLARHERFSPAGERYWDEVGAVLAAQGGALGAAPFAREHVVARHT